MTEISILHEIIEDKITPSEAAAKLAPYAANIRGTWSCLVDHALLNADVQPALVSLAKALLDLPSVPGSSPVSQMALVMLEQDSFINDAVNGKRSSDPTHAVLSLWLSMHSLQARLASAGLQKLIRDDGQQVLSRTLEPDRWISLHANIWDMRKQQNADILRIVETNLLAAAQWVFHAGQLLYACKSDATSDRSGETYAHGFSDRRWMRWKSGFGRVQDQEHLSDEVKAWAQHAVVAMEDVEAHPRLQEWKNIARQHSGWRKSIVMAV